MPLRTRLTFVTLLVAVVATPIWAHAQSLDLTIKHTGLSIGDSRFVRGVRVNFRDRNLELVEGVNVTVWTPYEPARGVVKGIGIGLPITGARRIEGVGIGIFGVGAEQDFNGIGLGGFGVGAGHDVTGIVIGGFGARMYWRAKRSEARFHAAQTAAERQRLAAPADHDNDD